MQKENLCSRNAILVMLSLVKAGSFPKVREREKIGFVPKALQMEPQ